MAPLWMELGMPPKPRPENCFLNTLECIGTRHGRKVWRSEDGMRLFTWDSLHGEIEVFDKRKARVSATTSAIALVGCLQPGYAFVEIDNTNKKILYFGQSPETWASAYESGRIITGRPFPTALKIEMVQLSHSTITWADFTTAAPMPSADADERDWREILDGILDDLGLSSEEAAHAKWSISGIIGSANTRVDTRSPEVLYQMLRVRFSGKHELEHIVTHRDFDAFLRKRSLKIIEGEGKKPSLRSTRQ